MAAPSTGPSKLDLFHSSSQCYISSFLIISPRGSTILSKDFRGDLPYRKCVEIFWQNIKTEEQQFESSSLIRSSDLSQNGHYAPSCFFNIHNVSYIYHKNIHNIYYLMLTKCNISPSYAMESMYKLIQSFCDYCGRRTMNGICLLFMYRGYTNGCLMRFCVLMDDGCCMLRGGDPR